jgi:hypothetical protein
MTQFVAAAIGLIGVVIGVLAGVWQQRSAREAMWAREDAVRWQRDRRELYMRHLELADQVYRALDNQDHLGRTLAPTPDQEARALDAWDQMWRTEKEIQLMHASKRVLEASERLLTTTGKLFDLAVHELPGAKSDGEHERLSQAIDAINDERRRQIPDFLLAARDELGLPDPGK